MKYTYDNADNLASISYPDGLEVSYEYDQNDNIVKITDRNAGVPLGQSGLREPDFIELERRHLNENATLSALFE